MLYKRHPPKNGAQGPNGKREQELMVIQEAIVANTDPALEADVPKAAEALLDAPRGTTASRRAPKKRQSFLYERH